MGRVGCAVPGNQFTASFLETMQIRIRGTWFRAPHCYGFGEAEILFDNIERGRSQDRYNEIRPACRSEGW